MIASRVVLEEPTCLSRNPTGCSTTRENLFLDVRICSVHWTDDFCPTLRRLQLGNQPKPSEAFQFWISSFCMKIAHKRRLCKDTGKQGCLVRVCSDVCIAHCAIKCKKNKGNIQKDRQTDKCNKQVIEGNNQKKKCNKKY